MMKIQLYKYDGTPLFEVMVDASSSQSWSLMSDNKLSLSFELEECVVLTAGCYIEFDNTRFYLLTEYKPTMVCRSAWKYDLTLGDAASWLSITLALKTTDGENAPLFKYTGPAVEHAAIIVANLNRLMGTDKWKVGSVISTENITIDYSGKYCSEVLQEIVDIKNTEWWIDDMTLNIGRAEFGDPIELGYQNGLLGDIIREQSDNSKSYRYLYPVGSTRNIDPTKYGYDRLQLPDGRTYIDMNVEQGIAELFEEAAFAHIFPRYEGTVQTVRAQIANGNSGPFVIYYFSDSNLPFNPNDYEIAGLKKQISFLSGELMGEDFEVNYNPSSKEFEIITKYPESSNNIQLPGGLLIPNIGDKYVIWNITMPAEYYSLASQELLEAAEAFAQKYIYDGGIYHASLDYIDVQLRSLRLRPGQRVRLQSPEYFPKTGHYDSRITRVTRSLWYPNEMNIDISSERSMGVIKKLSSDVKSAQTKSNTLSATLSTLNAAFVAHKMLFDEFFEKDSAGNIHAKLSLWSSGGITAGEVGSGGSGGGGISYNRLDSWADYSADKAGYVLSALLGKDLDNRVSTLANAGYITASYLAPYALRSEIPTNLSQLTNDMIYGRLKIYSSDDYIGLKVINNKELCGIGFSNANTYDSGYLIYLGGVDYRVTNDGWTKVYKLLHEGNYSDFVLPITGGTLNGNLDFNANSTNSTTIRYLRMWYSSGGSVYRGMMRVNDTNLALSHYSPTSGVMYELQIGKDGLNFNDVGVVRKLLHSGNYSDYALPKTGGTLTGTTSIPLYIKSSHATEAAVGFGANNAKGYGYIVYKGGDSWAVTKEQWGAEYSILHTGNYSNLLAGGTINGSITATSFIGNLTGNADSASCLRSYFVTRPTSANQTLTGKGRLFKMLATSSMTDGKPDGDGHIIHSEWDLTNGYDAQLFLPNNTFQGHHPQWRAHNGGSWGEWITIIDSGNISSFNAGSATKLATPRTIWGQPFDGTGNISGNLSSDAWRIITDNSTQGVFVQAKLVDGTSDAGRVYITGHNGAHLSLFNVWSATTRIKGNVGIGIDYPSEALHVNGNGKFTGALSSPAITTNTLKVGNVTLVEENGALKVIGGFIATGGVTSGEKAS